MLRGQLTIDLRCSIEKLTHSAKGPLIINYKGVKLLRPSASVILERPQQIKPFESNRLNSFLS